MVFREHEGNCSKPIFIDFLRLSLHIGNKNNFRVTVVNALKERLRWALVVL